MQITTGTATTSRPAKRRFRSCTFVFIFILAIAAYLNFYAALDAHNCLNGYVGDVSQMPQAETKSANDHSSAKPSASVSVPVAASRLERMTLYQERYKYRPPAPYTNHSVRDEVCGFSPDYNTFFSFRGGGKKSIRSVNEEDKTIYELFFKKNDSDDSADPPIKGNVVEMGAFNGLQESNSHFFDICLGWETLLVEGNPLLWDQVVTNRPHAHRFSYAPSCSEEDEIANKTVKFDRYPMTNGGLADGSVKTSYTARNRTIDVPCGSLTKVLLDVFPNGHVSFFSLDVEGAEPLVVGKAINFDKVFIEILMIENRNNFCEDICKSREEFRKIMMDAGYVMFSKMVTKSDVFIHPLSKHLETVKKRGIIPTMGEYPTAIME
mmetsp:Transcript_11699/g.21278  ORF Transcript_11699/g.21278 Transcript_11699/m.21278 type:complete len:379 (-) Transcript_11699:32-1168(-)